MIWNIIGTVMAMIIIALIALRLMIVRGGQGVHNEDPKLFVREPKSPAKVISLPSGGSKIDWNQQGSVKILVSTTPDQKEQELLSTLQSEQSFTHLKPEQNLRHFYTIQYKNGAQTITAARIWNLPGILNLRDIGGYKTTSGRFTRWGKIYRTAHLGNATDETLEILNRYNISMICDLRSNRELSENPDRIPDGATYAHTPIYRNDQLSGIFPKLLFDRASLGDQLGMGYIRMVNERVEAFADIIGRFADPANLPAMFHCTAGKDRVGLTTAMLLSLLGVPRETIIADYTLSNLASTAIYDDFMKISGRNINRLGVPLEQLKPLFVADPKWIKNALKHIDSKFGGVENYLIDEGGLTADRVAAIRENLLD